MKKGLVTAFVIASVLAFNACKKEEGPAGADGATGPTGPQGVTGATGPTGATGAQGPIGPQGVKGDDGTKILAGTTAPGASTGADGDFYFDTASKTLYGPKAAGAWPAGISLQGADGATGANGADGASFIAGSGAPNSGDGNVGDWWFDTENSTFYGPKGTTGWGSGNVLPLGRAFGARTYHLIRGFDDVTQTSKIYAQKLEEQYSDYTLLSSYRVSAEDKRRFDNYSLWHENREMIFETIPNSGVFNRVPRGAFDFAGSGVAVPAALAPGYGITVGANFKYTNAPASEAHHTYTLLQEDVDRLSVNNGAAFTYLTYAATKAEDVVVGEYLTFYQKKSLDLVEDTDNYYATYTAVTSWDLNQIEPKLEQWKKDGAYVFLGYNYYEDNIAPNNNQLVNNYTLGSRGYIDITDHLKTYVNGNVDYGNGAFNTGAGYYLSTPYTSTTSGSANMNHTNNPFVTHLISTTSDKFGAGPLALDADQIATPDNRAARAYYRNGKFYVEWNITSGTPGTHTLNISPLTLTNPGNLAMEDLIQSGTGWVDRAQNREYYTPPRLDYGFNTTTYPIVNSATTYTPVYGWISILPPIYGITGYNTVTGATGINNVRNNNGGKPASYFEDHNLIRLTLNVVPAEIVKNAKAAGIDVNNPEALVNFANSLQLQ